MEQSTAVKKRSLNKKNSNNYVLQYFFYEKNIIIHRIILSRFVDLKFLKTKYK